MYLESYMSRVLDIPKYRANKDKDKINLVYFIRFIHYKLVSYDKQCSLYIYIQVGFVHFARMLNTEIVERIIFWNVKFN